MQSGNYDNQVNGNCLPIIGGRTYLLDLQLKGRALVSIYLLQYSSSGRLLKDNLIRSKTAVLLGEFALATKQYPFLYARRFKALNNTTCINIQIKYYGSSHLLLERAIISQE